MRRVMVLSMAIAVIVAGCGGEDGDSSRSESGEGAGPDEVTLVLDYLMDGNKAPFVLGREKGFFEEEGIDLKSIEESGGSSDAVKLVANGRFDFGTSYATDFAIGVDKELPITMLAVYQPRDQAVIVVREDSGIDELADLNGKKMIIGTDESRILVEDVLKAAGADPSSMKIEEVDGEQRNALFLQGRADAAKVPFEAVVSMQGVDPDLKVKAFSYAQYGFNTMNQGLLARKDLIEKDPDLVRRFVAAAMKSYIYAVEHPEEVTEVVPPLYPAAKAEILEQELNISFALLGTENTAGHPFGYMAPEDWESTLEVLSTGEVISGDVPAEEFYTNEFIGEWKSVEPQGEFAAVLGGG
jgi:NitT/TauT family transport system substrate-binding protein